MFRRCAHAQKLSRERNFAQLRNTYHSIRLDELNQDIVVLLLRMRSCAIRDRSLRSSRIQMQLVETNLTTCVSSLGDASFQRYRRFRLLMRRFRNSQLPRMRSGKTKISRERSVAQRRHTPHSIRLDRSAPESANSEKIGVELGNCACAVEKLRYLELISTNLCAVDGFLFSSSRRI